MTTSSMGLLLTERAPDGVFRLLAGLLGASLRLVGAALGFELLVVRRPTGAFLRLALELLTLIPQLVLARHRDSFPRIFPGRPRRPPHLAFPRSARVHARKT